MKILVANLGSTSFKYRLYDLDDPAEPLLARGAIERIGSDNAKVAIKSDRRRGRDGRADRRPRRRRAALPRPVDRPRDRRARGRRRGRRDRLQGGPRPEPHRRAPGRRGRARGDGGLRRRRPRAQPALHQGDADARRPVPRGCRWSPPSRPASTGTIPEANQRYAIPDDWATELGIRRWGFHGASHRYIAGRMAELLGRDDLKIISCHLGGSSSLCAIRDGKSVACSLGMSPQSGPAAQQPRRRLRRLRPAGLLRETGLSLDEILDILANQSGLEGLGGCGPRPPRHRGRGRRPATRRPSWPSTSSSPRSATTSAPTSSSWAGPTRSSSPAGSARTRSVIRAGRLPRPRLVRHRARPGAQRRRPGRADRLGRPARASQVWTVPTNEEIVVARQACDLLALESTRIESIRS